MLKTREPDTVKWHDLKTWPPYFQQILDGDKTFDLRINDRDFQPGDYLIFREFIPTPAAPPEESGYTLRVVVRKAGVILYGEGVGEWGLSPDSCILSLLQT